MDEHGALRRRGWGLAALGAAALACAGPAGSERAAPVSATETEKEPEPLPEGTHGLWWLEDIDGSCHWQEWRFGPATVDEVTLAKLPGRCPRHWRIAVPKGSDRIVLYGQDGGAVLGRGEIVRFRPIPDASPLVSVLGEEVIACGTVEGAEVETGRENHYEWSLGGKTYTVDSDDPVAPRLTRTWRLTGSGWAERSVEPTQGWEGQRAPHCWLAEGWPEDSLQLSAESDPEPDTTGWRPPSETESPLLAAIRDEGWSVHESGRVAAPSTWLGGIQFSRPVAWNPEGNAWQIVPELAEGGSSFDILGDWLLANNESGSVLRDLTTGESVRRLNARAVFAPDGLVLPPMPPLDATPDVPARGTGSAGG